ncbi:MAG TPA: FKBP-type peptidyl-prolyl cis-trans isomerase [Acidimicrobiales bacterium]|nr:FKBP-type peptidyl-prolyl cis-trans isomerase [Acidimicrobiales bacterium]
MPSTHDRQIAKQRARRAAAAAARRRERRRKVTAVVAALAVLAVVAAIVVVVGGGDDDSDVSTSGSTTVTTAASPESAAGKPCVAVADPLPEGAPGVPVEVGPPPEQLVKEDLVEGTGAEVGAGATVTVHYIGAACSTGRIFDSSYSRGEPATFPLSGVIKGWTDGIPGMKVGGRRLLGIPADQAYGAAGRPPDIAPNEPLWFVVEVLQAEAAG